MKLPLACLLTGLVLLFLSAPTARAAGLNLEVYDDFAIVDGVIDFSAAQLVVSTTSPVVDLWNVTCGYTWNPLSGDDHYGARWYGYLRIDVAGDYGFGTVSDDGSQVWIDGQLVVDNKELQWWDWEDCVEEGSHVGLYPEGYGDPDSLVGRIPLAVGYHSVEVRYFEDRTYDGIEFWWLLPGTGPSDIPYYGTNCSSGGLSANPNTNWEIVPMSALETTLPSAAAPTARPALLRHEAFPNPFNPSTQLTFELARPDRVELEIFDLRGRRIRRVLPGRWLEAGQHSYTWDARSDTGEEVAGGVYPYRLRGGDWGASGRLVLLK